MLVELARGKYRSKEGAANVQFFSMNNVKGEMLEI